MFTNQSQAMAAIESSLGADAAQALAFMFQCENDLLHRGHVELKYTSPEGANSTDAPLSLYNYSGGGDRVNGIPEVGTALYVGAGNIVLNGGSVVNIGTGAFGGQAVRFYNGTGGDIPAGAVMRITGVTNRPIVTPTGVQFIDMLTVGQPNTSFQRLYAVNGMNPVANIGTGYCTLGGLGTALVTGSPSVGDSLGATNGSWSLVVNRPGFTVLGNVGTSLYAINQLEVTQLEGQLTAALAQGNSATFNVWFNGSVSSEPYVLTGYDHLMKSGAANIASGKDIFAQWAGGRWVVTEAECP